MSDKAPTGWKNKPKPKQTPEQRRNARLADEDFVTFEEKHGSYSFPLAVADDTRTKGQMWRDICYMVARQRDKEDYWYPNEAPKSKPKPADVDPKADMRTQKAQLQALENWENMQQYAADELAVWQLVEKVRAGDREAAVQLIESRRDHEYEKFSFERFTKLKVPA